MPRLPVAAELCGRVEPLCSHKTSYEAGQFNSNEKTMCYQKPETKWQKAWRLLKKWHPLWLPLAIIFFDRLFIMWPYIPMGEATFYMKTQAIETFDWSIWWTIHVAETLFLLYLWVFVVCFHIGLCLYLVRLLNRLWKEAVYQRALEKSIAIKIHRAVAAEQVHKYFRQIYKESKQEKYLIDYFPFGQFAVQALPRLEFRAEAKSLPSHKIPGDLPATPADFADYMSAFKYVLKRVRETFEKEVLPARRQGKVVEVQPAREGRGNSGQTVSGTRGKGKPAAGPNEPDNPETVMTDTFPSQPPAGEAGLAAGATVAPTMGIGGGAGASLPQESPVAGDKPSAGLAGPGTLEPKPDEAESVGGSIDNIGVAASGQMAEPPLAAKISVEKALSLIQNKIEAKNDVRRITDQPPLTEAEEMEVKQTYFNQVDPEELATWQAKQEAESRAAGGESGVGHGCQTGAPAARRSTEEESGLVGVGPAGQEAEELEDDEDYPEEGFSPQHWKEKLALAEGNSFVAALSLFMTDRDEWKGPPSDLLILLNNTFPEKFREANDWPKSAAWLTKYIKRASNVLLYENIHCDWGRGKQSNWLSLTKT